MLLLKQKKWEPFTLENLFNIQGSKTTPLKKLKNDLEEGGVLKLVIAF